MNQVSATDLSYSYGAKLLFQGVSFAVASGELLILKGGNGTGKSTMLCLLAGLRKVQQGKIEIQARLSYLGADKNGLYLNLSAMANLSFWQALLDQAHSKEQIKEKLKIWGLAHPLLHLYPVATFSTGMKRRLALVRTILADAPLWLLDEPLLGLDQEGVLLFQKALTEHLNNGGSCIMASHDAQFSEAFAARSLFF